ncbi:transcriptional regulator [Microtetraspora sp. NBRC 13810]|nr:transcriptional regulator [Microtetraspora sp. NBRC 13810]
MPPRGRDAERETVREMIGGARAGHGSALLLTGATGMGKTTMLGVAAEDATGCTVLRAVGAEAETGIPFAGLHALLRPVAGHLGELPPAQAAALGEVLDAGGGRNGLPLRAAVLGVLAAAARRRPVLACVDDVHLFDRESREALFFAARRLGGDRVALLFAGREGGGPRLPRSAGLPELPLGALGDDACHALLQDAAPGGLPADVRAPLVRLAAGNPLALIELAGALTPEQRSGDAPPPESPPRHGRLWRAHAHTLARLPGPTRRILLLVAADPELETDTLLRAADPQDALAALEPAEAEGITEISGRRIGFHDALIRPVVYQEASLAQRRAAHRVLARVLDHDQHRLRRAWHRAAALDGPHEELADELDAAAARARDHGGYLDSSRAFERAAELTAGHTAKASRLAAAAYDAWLAGRPQRTRVLLARLHPFTTSEPLRVRAELIHGNLELRGGETSHARDELLNAAEWLLDRDRALAVRALLRAGEASYLAGDHQRYLAIARYAAALRRPDDPAATQLVFEHLDGLAATFRGEHDKAAGPLRRVLELAARVRQPAELMRAGIAALMLGEDAQALALSTRAVETARARGAAATVPHALESLINAELWMGRYAAVTAHALEGFRLANETGQRNSAAQHLGWLALMAAIQGEEEECRVRAASAIELAGAHGLGIAGALGNWALACLELSRGNTADAANRLRNATWSASGNGHLVVQVMATPHFVEAAVRTGDRDRAEAELRVLDRWVSSTRSPDRHALAARCRALLAPAREAESHFRDAIELHRKGSCEFELARTQLLFGGALRRSRRPGAAREHLHGALTTFERLDARLWAEQARGELRASGEAVRPRARRPVRELTAQQLQIARMVAGGATNREVAAQLFLSPRTVEHHLRNVFARLDIRSRVELARLFS